MKILTRNAEVPVWDRFVRVFHWATVGLFASAFLSPDMKFLHEPLGYAVLMLTAARIVWGFAGPSTARFANFVGGPRRVFGYLRLLVQGRAPRYLGHNPAGGAMIVALLGGLLVTAISGWMTTTDRWFGIEWVSRLHAASAHLLLLLIGVHVLAVLLSGVVHGENLVRAMVTGRKPANSADHRR